MSKFAKKLNDGMPLNRLFLHWSSAKGLLLFGLILLLLPLPAFGQQTNVSATVVAPTTLFPWQAATGMWALQCPGNEQAYIGTTPVLRSVPITRLSGSGSFTSQLADTSFLVDVNSQPLSCSWRVSLTDACGVATFSTTVTGITGTSVDVSSQINAAAVPLSAACTPPGTLDSVTLSNLVPLFTVTQGGTTINPTYTFNAISQSQGLFYASPAVGSGLPLFRVIQASDLPAGTVTSVTASSPITSSGGSTPNIACPTCTVNGVTAVNGTANEIASSGGTTPTLSIPSTFIAPGSIKSTTSITAGNLATNQCVQTSTGGLLTGTGSPCANVNATLVQSVQKTSEICTTTSSSFNTCPTTINWPVAFADTGYSVVCSGVGPNDSGNTDQGRVNLQVGSKATGSVVVNVVTVGASAVTWNEIDCQGIHP